MPETLDALALAQLPEDDLIARLAWLFRKHLKGRTFERLDEGVFLDWVQGTFGDFFPAGEELRLAHALLIEHRQQTYVAERRRRPVLSETHVYARRQRLADAVLGPPAKHMIQKLAMNKPPRYTEVRIRAGLVAGIIPGNELTGEKHLLVFRAPGARRVQQVWVGPLERGVDRARQPRLIDAAVDWLTPPVVSEARSKGLRVEIEWHRTRWRIYYQDGRSSLVPWRLTTRQF